MITLFHTKMQINMGKSKLNLNIIFIHTHVIITSRIKHLMIKIKLYS